MSVTIDKAKKEDIPEIAKLVNNAYRGPVSRKGWTHEADLVNGDKRTDEKELERLMNDADSVFLVYRLDGKIIGSVFLEKNKESVYLGMLSVHPDHQDKGIGRSLINASENYAREIGANSIIMSVISVRKELISWYERLGYHPNGESKPFPVGEAFGDPKMPLEFIYLEKKMGV